MNMNVRKNTIYMVKVGMLAAIGFAFMYLEIPVLPAYPFLKLDFSEVPVLIGGFALGPVAAIIIEVLKNIAHFFLKGDGTGGLGNIANIIVGCAFAVPAAWYYLKHKTHKSVFVALIIGTISMILVGILGNYFVFLPLYGIAEHSAKVTFIIGGIIPINAIKAVATSIITLFLYKPLSPLLHKQLREKNVQTENQE